MQQSEVKKIQNDDEISIVDILRFLGKNYKFLALITTGLSAIAIILALLQPKQYQKQLTLSVRPLPVPVANFPVLDVHQAGALAISFLQDSKLNLTIIRPVYDPTTQQISLTLSSPEASSLNGASSGIGSQLQIDFEEIMDKSLETSLTATEADLERMQQILGQLDRQKAQFSPTNEFRLGAVEAYRINPLVQISQLEFDKQYLEQAQKNLAEFTAQFISIRILTESETPPTRSLMPVIVIAVIASFTIAILAAIIREQIPRLKAELSKHKIDTSQDV